MADNLKQQFERDVQEMVDWMLEEHPTWATHQGVHTNDHRLGDASIDRMEANNRRVGEFRRKFEAALSSDDLDTQIDAELMVAYTGSQIRGFEEVQGYCRAPQQYIGRALSGCNELIIRDFAPLPERLTNLIGRLSEIPALLEQGKKNITQPGKAWTQLSIGMTKGGISFFENDIPLIAQQVPDLAPKVIEASAKAAEAARNYLRFLEEDLLPKANGGFAAGEDMFNRMLRETHMMDVTADDLERKGWELIEETERQFDELAASAGYSGTRNEIVFEISKKHPAADDIVPAYAKAMADSRQFIIDQDLMTLPEGERMEMHAHPKYVWHLLPFCSYGPPGPFAKEQVGVFGVTPIDPDLPPDAREARLRSHPWAKIPIHAVHEGYPGHHVQFVWANLYGTLARKFGCVSTLHEEGWAFYTEQLMEEKGFLGDIDTKIFRLKEQLWRACRIVIDVGIQTREMSLETAAQMLVDRAGFEWPDAMGECVRYTLAPTQPMSYLIGKLELLKTFEEYKRRKGSAFDLKTFHNELLACGALTPKLIRKKLFGG